jgi:uncharacterized protein
MRSRHAIVAWGAFLFLLAATAPALASEPKFPPLTGRVVDDAGILNASTKSQLTDALAKQEDATGDQVVVVTLPSLQGYSVEDFGYQLGRYWGIGQKGKNNGVLLIVAPNEHKVRIEVGYGLEGELTDAICRTIIESDILPNFRSGNFNAGVLAGTASVLKVLGWDAHFGTQAGSEPDTNGIVGSQDSMSALAIALVCVWAFIVFTILTDVYFKWTEEPNWVQNKGTSPRRVYGGIVNSGGFYGGGFGGGGFSGGGGSFGGGGASGGW